MKQARVRQYDAFTGEEMDGSLVYIPPRRKNGFSQGWVAMEKESVFEMIAAGKFSGTSLRVWAALMMNLEYENIIRKSQRQIALSIGMSPQNFNAGVNQLCDEEIFLRYKKDGRTELRLNPEHGWKGSAKNHVIALSEVRKQRGRPATHTPA
jgi:hypothetical protein